jgi:hypothetical protein
VSAAVQLNLFAPAARTRRLVDGLTCLRDSMPSAMYVVIHLADWRPREERGPGFSGDWAYAIRRDGLRIEHANDWRGWDHTPAHRITWAELAEQLAGDPRRAELIAWSASLPEPAWQDLARPHELWPEPEKWHPHYIEGDHERPGWDQRLTAWRTLQAILSDAMARLDPEVSG